MNPYHRIDYQESENHAPESRGSNLKAPLVSRTQKMVKNPNYFDIKCQNKRFLIYIPHGRFGLYSKIKHKIMTSKFTPFKEFFDQKASSFGTLIFGFAMVELTKA